MKTNTSTKSQHQQKIADELAHLLADTYTLYLKTQNFHWNVTGPNFPAFHLMFERQYEELADAVDVIAERIRALGSKTPASFSQFLKLTSLKDATNGSPSAEEMAERLMHDHETIVNHALHILEKAKKDHDEATMDLLIERIREHEKTAWMLRSSASAR